MAYREAVERSTPRPVVHYRPMHPLVAMGVAVIVMAFSAFTLFQALTYARAVRFDCVRGGENVCVVLRDYGLVTTRQELPAQDIVSVHVTSHSGKNGTNYGVSLRMRAGDTVALMRPGSHGYAERTRSGVEAVLNPALGSTGVLVQDSSPVAAFFMGLMGVGIGAMTLLFTRSARLEFDLDRARVHYTRQRWPLRPARRTFALAELTRARVVARPGGRGGTIYETALGVRGEADFILVSGGGGSEKRNEAAVAKINAMLEKMRSDES